MRCLTSLRKSRPGTRDEICGLQAAKEVAEGLPVASRLPAGSLGFMLKTLGVQRNHSMLMRLDLLAQAVKDYP